MAGQVDTWDGWIDGWIVDDGWMDMDDGWMWLGRYGWMDGWKDGGWMDNG